MPVSQTAEKLFAVVPAFNERENLEGLLVELRAVSLEGASFETVVVDDGSSDGTADCARRLGFATLVLPFNVGIGATVQTGFQHALVNGADFVVQVDGDGQHIPSEIVKLIAHLRANPNVDVVVGSRNLELVTASTTQMRRWAGAVLSNLVYLLTGARISDPTSGFRVFRKNAAAFIAEHYPDDYPEAEILVMLVNAGFTIAEVPVRMRARRHGKSSISGWRPFYYMLKVIFASIVHRVRRVKS